jgi:hypothetical protein
MAVSSATTSGVGVVSGEGYTTGVSEGWYTHYAFLNYCPNCGHYNCLIRGLKRNDELTCIYCDSDYSFSGREKVYHSGAWLTPYYPEPEPEPVVSKMETPQKAEPQSKMDVLNETFQTHRHKTKLIHYL